MNGLKVCDRMNNKFQKLNDLRKHYLYIQNQKIIDINYYLPDSKLIEPKLLAIHSNDFLKYWFEDWFSRLSKVTGYEYLS